VKNVTDTRLFFTFGDEFGARFDKNVFALLLPPPRRICNRRCRSVYLSVSNFAQKTCERICMKCSEKVGNKPCSEQTVKFWWRSEFTVWIQGMVSGFVAIGRYKTSLTDINLLLILICQMAALVRRTLAEVCTVPVLLVMIALCNSADRYIFALWFLSSFFFSSRNLSGRRLDVYHTSTHSVALVRI